MNINYMIDTNIVNYIVKGQSQKARRKLRHHSDEDDVYISSITEAEIRYGLAKKSVTAEVRAAVEQFLLNVDILPWDSAAAKVYGEMRVKLESGGKSIANMDLLIAAHAAATGSVLVTNDKVFQYAVGSFATVNWADDVSPK